MNAPVMACLLVLAGVVIGDAYAEPDPQVFLDMAERLQEKIRPQIAGSSDETKNLFEEGTKKVAALEQAIADGDAEAAKENFHAAMMIFKEISGEEWDGVRDAWSLGAKDPTVFLEKIQKFVAKARNLNPDADFTQIDGLFARASQQIADDQPDAAFETLREAKAAVMEVHGGPQTGTGRDGMPDHDARIFLKIAERLQEKIRPQIAGSSDETKNLFEEGTKKVAALEQAIADGDAEAAKENFHAAMMIFKEISGKEWQDRPSNVGNDGSDGLSGLLARMQAYADNLELVAKKNSVTVDFAGLDRLFARASQQVADGQPDAALKTIHEAKETIKMINKEIRGEVSEHGSKRSLAYAAKYIERLDGMIEESKERGAADQTVAQLRADLDTARETLEMIKQHVKDGKPHDAGELLRDLAKQLRSIKAALGS